jgi:hypothetical protein
MVSQLHNNEGSRSLHSGENFFSICERWIKRISRSYMVSALAFILYYNSKTLRPDALDIKYAWRT